MAENASQNGTATAADGSQVGRADRNSGAAGMASSETGAHQITADLCIIGAGAAGLSVAAGAAQMGAKVVLIEKHIRDGVMGGECLHTGCVPSKAMLAAGKQAHAMRKADTYGIAPAEPRVDFAKVNDHVRSVIETISPIDSVDRFEDLGVTVLEGKARFLDRRTLEAAGVEVRARRFVIATGSKPAVPPIPGIESVPYFTNETVFENRAQPEHLIIVGGGPIGMELAQAHRRLGSKVTVLERFKVLPRDDPDFTEVVIEQLLSDGVAIEEDVEIGQVSQDAGGQIAVQYRRSGQHATITGSHLLIAAGRKASFEGLNLSAAGVDHTDRGIIADDRMLTSNRRIFAIGDCVANNQQFTHVAGYQAGIVIRNALFWWPARADLTNNPRVTYTDPELAHVGLTEQEARDTYSDAMATEWPYAENDRAQADGIPQGRIKVMTRKNGQILGVTIVGAQAGEVLQPWLLALSKKMKMSDMTGYIAPYPTLGEISKRAAGKFYTPVIFGPMVQRLVRFVQWLP